MTRLLVTTAMGDDDYWNSLHHSQRNNNNIIHHMLYPHTDGIFKGLEINDFISAHILRTQIDPVIGDKIEKARDGSFNIGYVDLGFDDAEEQMDAAMRIEDLIQIDIG